MNKGLVILRKALIENFNLWNLTNINLSLSFFLYEPLSLIKLNEKN